MPHHGDIARHIAPGFVAEPVVMLNVLDVAPVNEGLLVALSVEDWDRRNDYLTLRGKTGTLA